MGNKLKKYRWLIVCTATVAGIEIIKFFPAFIERWYSNKIFRSWSLFERKIFGWLPVSFGDVLVAVTIVFFIYQLIALGVGLLKKNTTRNGLLKQGKFLIIFFTTVYAFFYLSWGLNYYRLGSSYQLQLTPTTYSTADIDSLNHTLNARLQRLCSDTILLEQAKEMPREKYIELAKAAYTSAAKSWPFLAYNHQSIKPTLLGKGLNYFGTLGYANPLTGEAQINYSMPRHLWAYTICHEMAHQLGYADESEANLMGYLAAKSSENLEFSYSVYSSLQAYAFVALYQADSNLAITRKNDLPGYVRSERIKNRAFFAQYSNPFDTIIYWIYDRYLKANNQPLGQQTYNYVIAWLIAYAKKYGWENL